MQRRTFLIWFGRAVYTACAALVAAPSLRFLGAPLASKQSEGGTLRRRIVRLDALPQGEPQKLAVIGTREDAWTRHPDQTIGHIWVTRHSPPSTPPEKTELSVFNAACPHSGCPIQQAMSEGFACHCHGAKFATDGTKVPDGEGFLNPSPRGMDPLDHRIVQDQVTGQWWLEVEYKEFEVGLADRVEKT